MGRRSAVTFEPRRIQKSPLPEARQSHSRRTTRSREKKRADISSENFHSMLVPVLLSDHCATEKEKKEKRGNASPAVTFEPLRIQTSPLLEAQQFPDLLLRFKEKNAASQTKSAKAQKSFASPLSDRPAESCRIEAYRHETAVQEKKERRKERRNGGTCFTQGPQEPPSCLQKKESRGKGIVFEAATRPLPLRGRNNRTKKLWRLSHRKNKNTRQEF